MDFINTGQDIDILRYINLRNTKCKCDQDELVKALDKSKLVQKEIQVRGKNGQIFTRKQWVKASDEDEEEQPQVNQPKPQDDKKKKGKSTSQEVKEQIARMLIFSNLKT